MTVSLVLSRRLTTKHLSCSVVSIFCKLVVSLHYADNCGGPFTSRLSDVNQSVIGPRIKFSLILPDLVLRFHDVDIIEVI